MAVGTCELCGMSVVWNTLELSAHMDRCHNKEER